MKNVDVSGRAIRDLAGLQQALLAANFLVVRIDSDENKKGAAYTRVVLDDAETKDPASVVRAFVDVPARRFPEQVFLSSPDGTEWALSVDDTGKVIAIRV